ncbi:ABC transporter permease [Paenibacillus alba]|uniref:ABC-2 family transporter protein n=1 Tax=Paenibacillus alba TaxID=1197127 RepID=A0ABU6FUU7_9BACL|nr:ABC-2 family transporter protein [Paenibacillus alba]MEC0225668.1 ABC-2 family transporter protein [Paenibacillus alba]
MKRKISRSMYLYMRLMSQQLKAILEYQADFLLLVIAAGLTQAMGLIFIWVIYQKIPQIHGWDFWEVIFIYAIINFTTGVSQFFFEGTWRIGFLVNSGELDRMLLRPISPVLQVLSGAVGMNGLGNMVVGGIMLVNALRYVHIEWTWDKALIGFVLFISAMVTRTAINLISNSLVFWTHAPNNSLPMMVSSLAEFAKFPITIYSFGVQLFFSLVLPYAFVSFFPAAYLFDKMSWGWIGLLTPLAAIYCVVLGIAIFRKGLSQYEGAGS